MINRQIQEFGLPPLLGYILAVLLFVALSFFLFSRAVYPSYIYCFIAISFIFGLSEVRRNRFLMTCFSTRKYRMIRAAENAFIVLPFIIILCAKFHFIESLGLFIFALLLSMKQFGKGLGFTLPTPFSKHPFEFALGFRKSIFFIAFAYFLLVMAISVSNFNLGVFSLILLCFTSLMYYEKPEGEYFVWIFSDHPKEFLNKKLKMGLFHLAILCFPTILALVVFFPSHFHIVLGIFLLGGVYLIAFILAKYSAFPHPMHLPQAILFGICFLFPPFLIGVIPYFYKHSLRKVGQILA